MFSLFGRKAKNHKAEMSVEVLRAMVEASKAHRAPGETLNEMMKLGNQEIWPHGKTEIPAHRATAATSAEEDIGFSEELDTTSLVELLNAAEATPSQTR